MNPSRITLLPIHHLRLTSPLQLEQMEQSSTFPVSALMEEESSLVSVEE
jgi:hypothetical protein